MENVDKKTLFLSLGASMALLYFGKKLEEKAQHKRMMQDLRANLALQRARYNTIR